MRRGQVELIGMVFVVLVLVVGLILYVRFAGSNTGTEQQTQTSQSTSAFLTALRETNVPECRANVERVARACQEEQPLCTSGKPCIELQKIFDKVAQATLYQQGLVYNLSLEKTAVMTGSCNSSDQRQLLVAAPVTDIVLTGGNAKGRIRLSICK